MTSDEDKELLEKLEPDLIRSADVEGSVTVFNCDLLSQLKCRGGTNMVSTGTHQGK